MEATQAAPLNSDADSPTGRYIDTVVMSGGAPQSPLMAGFLFSMWKKNKTFLNFHTSGAGALMALLFIAPKEGTPGAALKKWGEGGVADEIYKALPQNFKLFHKPGPFAPIFARLAERFKIPVKQTPTEGRDPVAELMAEMVGSLETYNSKLGLSLRKDPIEQVRDLWRAMAGVGPGGDLRDKLLEGKDPIRRLREMWLTSWFTTPEQQRFYNDMVDLMFSAMTPSTLSSKSLGLAAPLPFLEKIVDFDHLAGYMKQLSEKSVIDENQAPTHLCVNAYNMTAYAKLKQEVGSGTAKLPSHSGTRSRWDERDDELNRVMENFVTGFDPADAGKSKEQKLKEIKEKSERPENKEHPLDSAQAIRAAFSMPFIYPPAQIGDFFYSEGADHRPINFLHVERAQPPKQPDEPDEPDEPGDPGEPDKQCIPATYPDEPGKYPFVLLDVLGELEDHLVRKPRDLWDSYVISIMTPVVALATLQISEFKEDHPHADDRNTDCWRGDMLTVKWEIPAEAHPFVMDWSYSNLSKLFEVGERAGDAFVAKYEQRLRDRGDWRSLQE